AHASTYVVTVGRVQPRLAVMTSLPPPKPLPRLKGVDRARFEAEVVPAGGPVVLEGLVADWPAVAAARTPGGLRDYLSGLDAGRPVNAFRASPE
ncbi:cupin-like domain-containing protein, partial [Klebsiella pneumoniae]|uniref:cupin-like domain-containing protein n=1 Tax=Klebsiella pneumoniae TaxID=573 RepID=UPI0021099611